MDLEIERKSLFKGLINLEYRQLFRASPAPLFKWFTNSPYVRCVDRGGEGKKLVQEPVPNPMQIGHGEGFSSVASEHPIFEAFGIVERFVESEDRTL